MYAAGGRRWGGNDLETPKSAAHGIALQGPVVREVLRGDQAVAALHFGDDAFGDRAAVEAVAAMLGDLAQGPGQVRLAPVAADGRRVAVGVEEQATRLGVLAQARCALTNLVVESKAHLDPVLGEANRRRDNGLEGQGAVALECQQEPRHRARHAGGGVAEELPGAIDLAIRADEQVGGGGGRGPLAVVDEHLPGSVGEVQQHEAAAGQVAGARIGHGEGQPRGHGCIHGIAAGPEHLDARFGGEAFRAADHALPCDRGQKALPVVDDRHGGSGGFLRAGKRYGEGQGREQQRQQQVAHDVVFHGDGWQTLPRRDSQPKAAEVAGDGGQADAGDRGASGRAIPAPGVRR
jgi:hypothetical protein